MRSRLKEAKDAVSSAFIRLDGLSVEPTGVHAALLQYLRRAGCGDDLPSAPPRLVAFDWSCAEQCSAEGLAFFGVLSRLVREKGQMMIVCSPKTRDLHGIVTEAGLRDDAGPVTWISSQTGGQRITALAAPTLSFQSPVAEVAARPFVLGIEALLERNFVRPRAIDLTGSLLMELLQNVSTHATGAWASGVAVVHTRRRPAVLEIGLADTGDGLPRTVLVGPRLRWIVPLCDASVLEAFVANGLTSRAVEEGGGALRDVVAEFLTAVAGGVVLIRSGSALVRLDPSLLRSIRPTQLSYGFGTQIRIEIPLVST